LVGTGAIVHLSTYEAADSEDVRAIRAKMMMTRYETQVSEVPGFGRASQANDMCNLKQSKSILYLGGTSWGEVFAFWSK
jgi:hypothetical protein